MSLKFVTNCDPNTQVLTLANQLFWQILTLAYPYYNHHFQVLQLVFTKMI